LGIDVITNDISQPWQDGNFAILEINSAPGILMHLNPAIGASIDVPTHILSNFFPSAQDARIPIITFNKINRTELKTIINQLLYTNPQLTIGGVCREGIFINNSEKIVSQDYNGNIQTLLRHPRLDLLIAEYPEEILESEGMVYQGSNVVILDHPTETEMMLLRDARDGSIIIIKKDQEFSIKHKGVMEDFHLSEETDFCDVYLQAIEQVIE
jgi:cyanophycin synthetase